MPLVNSLFHSPCKPLGLAIRPALLEALRDEAQAVRHAAARVRAHGSRGGARGIPCVRVDSAERAVQRRCDSLPTN